MSLSKKIILQVVIISLVLFAAIFAFLNFSLQSYVKKSEWSLLDEKSESIESQITAELNTVSQSIMDIDTIITPNLEDTDFALETLTNLSGLFPDTNGFYAGLEDGRYLDGGGWVPEEGWDARTRDWYIEGKSAKNGVFYTEPYLDSQTGLTCVSITKALYNNNNFLGVLSFDYDFNIIQQIITSKILDNQICFIINEKGSFVYHKDFSVEDNLNTLEKGKYKDFTKKIISNSFDFSSTEFLGTRYYFTSKNVPGTDWHLVFGVTKADVEKSSQNINMVLIIGFIVMFVALVLVISFSLSKSIKPLKSTAESFRDISKGNADLTKRLKVQKKDEIGDVVIGFNEFVAKLQNIVSGIKASNTVLSQVIRICRIVQIIQKLLFQIFYLPLMTLGSRFCFRLRM